MVGAEEFVVYRSLQYFIDLRTKLSRSRTLASGEMIIFVYLWDNLHLFGVFMLPTASSLCRFL